MNKLENIFSLDSVKYSEKYFKYLSEILLNINSIEIAQFIDLIMNVRERGATIFFIGNGGSAATCSHFANDLLIGTASYQKPIRAISLVDNNAILTAIGNDYGYDQIFTRQLKMLARPGDAVVAISASGNSPNLVDAVKYCKEKSIVTLSLVGFDGGLLKQISDHYVHVQTGFKEYGPAEDAHMILDHLVMTFISRKIKEVA